MTTTIICNFCGGKIDGPLGARGTGMLSITPHPKNGVTWDYCRKCQEPLIEAISNISFRPKQQPLALKENENRTVADIQLEIEAIHELRDSAFGRDRPETIDRMIDALDKELDQARANQPPLNAGGQTIRQAINNLSTSEPNSRDQDWPYQPRAV